MFLELIMDTAIPIQLCSLPEKNVDVNFVLLRGHSAWEVERGSPEVLLHQCPDCKWAWNKSPTSSGCGSQKFSTGWKGHRRIYRLPVLQDKGQFCFEKCQRVWWDRCWLKLNDMSSELKYWKLPFIPSLLREFLLFASFFFLCLSWIGVGFCQILFLNLFMWMQRLY